MNEETYEMNGHANETNDEILEIRADSYPENLKHMYDPPELLYMRGTLPESADCKYLCVIGSRLCSSYGKEAVHKLISGLKGYPISIVSGLAEGIDSLSHIAALEAGLHCTAFPGTGLGWHMINPDWRNALAKKIISKGGAVISQWEADQVPTKWTFPARNKLMAGLAHATLIIEAGEKSGTLLTAEYATQFNREVMVVPGSIYSKNSFGPHKLLKEGATPITSADDILHAFGFAVAEKGTVSATTFANLDTNSKEIIETLSLGDATTDSLSSVLDLSAGELSAKLSQLELDGLIRIDGEAIKIA